MRNRCDASFENEEVFLKLKSLRKIKADLDAEIRSLEGSKRTWLNHPDESAKKNDLEALERMKKSSSSLGESIDSLISGLRSSP